MRGTAEAPSVLISLRLSARDRALLEALLARERRELQDLGVEVSLSSVMRKLIRAAAKGAAVAEASADGVRAYAPAATAPAPETRTKPAVSQSRVRALLRQKTAERRGLAAELARALGVERAQMSRFKAGNEAFPAAKLAGLFDLLSSSEA